MHDKAIKTLKRLYGKIPNYKAEDEYAVILGTVEAERRWAEANKEIPWLAVVKGINGVGFAIHSNSIQLTNLTVEDPNLELGAWRRSVCRPVFLGNVGFSSQRMDCR
jgi:hypothetical protein